MKYYRLYTQDSKSIIVAEQPDGTFINLTSANPELCSLNQLALSSSIMGITIDDLVNKVINSSNVSQIEFDTTRKSSSNYQVGIPFNPPEVWAAGVTYKSSEMERRRESKTPDIYSKIYDADRPELFLKATSDRCVGPYEAIGIRSDSEWNVPEPELAFVLYDGAIIGYTIGNDVSSRSIEGENPLYLPQAKFYTRSCAIGPCFVTSSSLKSPDDLKIKCSITRKGAEIFQGETSTSLINRSFEDLAQWLQKHNAVPNMTAVLTGTAIIPPPEITLSPKDKVSIEVEKIGILETLSYTHLTLPTTPYV